MRVAILVEAGAVPPPPDQLPMLLQAFAQWRDKWREKMEVFAFWAGRQGGLGVLNVADESELSQMMFEFPLNHSLPSKPAQSSTGTRHCNG